MMPVHYHSVCVDFILQQCSYAAGTRVMYDGLKKSPRMTPEIPLSHHYLSPHSHPPIFSCLLSRCVDFIVFLLDPFHASVRWAVY